ncbi:MAG: STAS domain-containing protein [Propionivibrio sp.]
MIEQSENRLRVTQPMLIGNASALLETGRGFLRAAADGASGAELVFDLSAVEETDSSALAVVFGLLRTARERGLNLRVVHAPASMLSQAALYGVADSLPLA